MRAAPEYFVAGGTLPRTAECYITRRADHELIESLRRGDLCYVLTSRQMGKSSMMVRAAARLRAEGCSVAVLDFTSLGQDVTSAQWYGGLLARIGRQLGLESEIDQFVQDNPGLSPLQLWSGALESVVLEWRPGNVILFFDEVDAVRSLPFSTDEFFASLRAFQNRKTDDPALNRLTFCLLGVASPSDLIANPALTPFNVGRRIELHDFTEDEALPLARGLGPNGGGRIALQRVLHWTAGHPYLTQRLCRAVAEAARDEPATTRLVDRVCTDLFFRPLSIAQEDNLLFVRERILRSGLDLGSLLPLYDRILRGRRVLDDDSDRRITLLRLAGLARSCGGRLQSRNRIYATVFGRDWVQNHLPDQEIRRQRAAFRLGALRTGTASLAVIILISVFAAYAVTKGSEAARREERVRQLLYASDMFATQQALARNDLTQASQLLSFHRSGPDKGFEYYYLWREAHLASAAMQPHPGPVYDADFLPDGRHIATASTDETVRIWSLDGRLTASLTGEDRPYIAVALSPQGLCAAGSVDGSITVWRLADGKRIEHLQTGENDVRTLDFSADGSALASGHASGTVREWSTQSWGPIRSLATRSSMVMRVVYSPAEDRIAAAYQDGQILVRSASDPSRLLNLRQGAVRCAAFSQDGRFLASGHELGKVAVWEAASGRLVRTLDLGSPPVAVSWLDGDSLVCAGATDGGIRAWDFHDGRLSRQIAAHESSVHSLAASPDGKQLVSSSWDGTAKIWSARRFAPPAAQPGGREEPVKAAAVSSDGQLAAVLTHEKSLEIWDLALNRRTFLLPATDASAGVSFEGDTSILAITDADGLVQRIDAGAGQVLAPVKLQRSCRQYITSADQTLFAFIDNPGSVYLGRRGSESPLQRVPISQGQALSLSFTSDGAYLAAGMRSGAIHIVRTKDVQVVWTLTGYRRGVAALSFSPDGRSLCAALSDHSLRVVHLRSGRETLTFALQSAPLAAAFSHDGSSICGIDHHGRVYRWSARDL